MAADLIASRRRAGATVSCVHRANAKTKRAVQVGSLFLQVPDVLKPEFMLLPKQMRLRIAERTEKGSSTVASMDVLDEEGRLSSYNSRLRQRPWKCLTVRKEALELRDNKEVYSRRKL